MELEGEPGERGREAAAEAEAMARRLGDPNVLVMALNGVFMQHYFGELARRERAATEMLELAQCHELPGAETLARLVLAQAHVKRADFATADAHVERVEELARRYDRPLILALVAFYHGLRQVVADRLDEAEAAAGAPEPIRRDYFYEIVLAARGRVGIALHDSARAKQAYIELTPFADLLIGGGTASVAMGPIAQVLGELAEHFGRPGEARAHYRQAATIAERAGAPRWAADARAALDRVR